MPHSETNPGLHTEDSSPRKEYVNFVESHLSDGTNGYGQSARFIRPDTLRGWWTKHNGRRIPRVLSPNTYVNDNTIISHYLIVFSILVYIGDAGFISAFIRVGLQDSHLPLLEPPKVLAEDPLTMGMLHNFLQYQWKFLPVIFSGDMFKKVIDPRQVLPIKEKTVLRDRMTGAKSTIEAVTLYPDCFDPEWSSTDKVVFKRFGTKENDVFRHEWNRECDVLTAIRHCDQSVHYLGSFEQNDSCVTMLEYANGGNLLDLFKRDRRPRTETEIHRYWISLMNLLKAINRYHNLKYRGEEERACFVHRDVNPENILVFLDEDDSFSSELKCKLADFETATAPGVMDANELALQDNNGNRTYSAPETIRAISDQESDLLQLSFHSDIWSFGCVLSNALVWLGGGWSALQNAEHERKQTIAGSRQYLVDGGYGSCFHDGRTVLPCVLASHRLALSSLPAADHVSQKVSGLIEQYMLQPPDLRAKNSMDVWTEFDKVFQISRPTPPAFNPSLSMNNSHEGLHGEGASPSIVRTLNPVYIPDRPSLTTPEPGSLGGHNQSPLCASPDSISPRRQQLQTTEPGYPVSWSGSTEKTPVEKNSSSLPQPSSGSQPAAQKPSQPDRPSEPLARLFPSVTVSDIEYYRHTFKRRDKVPGFDEFKQRMGDRHYVLLIDDSNTMRNTVRVLDTAENLAWLLKPIDSSGVEIRLASNPTKAYRLNSNSFRSRFSKLPRPTSTLFQPIRKAFKEQMASGYCNMEFFLNAMVREADFVNPNCPTSVLILTDGIWDGGDGRGVKGSIANIVKKMKSLNMARTDFTIQFVSFGNDPSSIGRLQYLDDNPPEGSQDWDIVDHKRHTDTVWAILWGAASDGVDQLVGQLD